MHRTSYEKAISEVKPITWFWLIGAIFGHPFYNVLAYLICTGQGWYIDTSTNVTLINMPIYVVSLLLIFVLRFAYHRWKLASKIKMNFWFSLEVFAQRKAFQTIGLLTFLMWAGEVEGNIAGFIYFPITILLGTIISILNLKRLRTIAHYISTQY
ncbi:MAG: hypothetical protein ABJF11_02600 [Reichenbachiella sp.]|uniref:hypothetical protein n=1 Tax=Reichenbachiella sp. TaxID=2184521 RepID=UPI0032655453